MVRTNVIEPSKPVIAEIGISELVNVLEIISDKSTNKAPQTINSIKL